MILDPLAPENTFPNVLLRHAQDRPDSVFMQDAGTGASVTYGGFDERARSWAAVLAQLGVRRGDAVVVVLPASIDCIAIWVALARLGAVEVPLNAAYRGKLLTHMIGNADAAVVVTCAEYLDAVLEVQPELTALRTIVLTDAAARAAAVEIVAFEEMRALDRPVPSLITPEPWDLACVMYTSGTTGPSKGVMVSWAQVYMTSTGCVPLDDLGPDDHWYIPYPLFHMSGKLCVAAAALQGSQAVIRRRFSRSKFFSDVRAYGCTTTLLIGSVPQLINALPPSPADRDHPLRNVEIAPMPADPRQFAARFGVRVCTIFNMTEISCPIMTNWDDFPPGSVGRLRPGYEVRIVDEHDRELPTGTVGEITVRADQPWVLNTGYWRMPDKTLEAWRNGWFHTGDAGYFDADGCFYFVDRLKDAIRTRGENISSMELEAEIGDCPGVRECAVLGVPSELGEEDVVAYVVADTADFDPASVPEFCRPRLPAFMVPRYVVVVDELPKTPTEKIRKRVLRESWDRSTAWDALNP
jgi:crotonobetaine/carnitine-CoA ligase